eukprot:1124458-Pyramimonas_sp.AAC.1
MDQGTPEYGMWMCYTQEFQKDVLGSRAFPSPKRFKFSAHYYDEDPAEEFKPAPEPQVDTQT